jgi:hypothetical protein
MLLSAARALTVVPLPDTVSAGEGTGGTRLQPASPT